MIKDNNEIAYHKSKAELNNEFEKKTLIDLFNNMPAIVGVFRGSQHIIEFANPGFYSLFADRNIIGIPLRESMPELKDQGLFELLDEVYKTGKPFSANEMPIMLDKKNNGILVECYFNFIYHPIFDTDHNVIGITDFAVEVTEQVIARQEVEKLNKELTISEAKYKSLAESLEIQVRKRTDELSKANKQIEIERNKLNGLFMNAPAAICILNGDKHVFEFANPVMEQLLGNTITLGQTIREALPEIEKQGFGDLLDKVYQTGEPEFGYEILAKIDKNKDGNLVEGFYNSVYQPIFDISKNVEGISVFGFEVTEQVKSREQIDKLYKEVQNSNSQLQNFASIASHDLQAPLRTITSYMQLLFKYSKDKFNPNELEFIDFIQNASKRMQELITNLLEYSKIGIEDNFYINHNLNEIMKIVLSDLQPLIKENNVTVSYTDLPIIKTDKIQIIRLFQNLITNSIKYRSSDNPVITISAKKENDYYLFSILDNGIGINEKYYDKIFEIFQRLETDKNVEGTGIGLANCKKIVEQHGGKIWVKSVEGEGSTFYFQLPV